MSPPLARSPTRQALPQKWQSIFALIDKAGGVEMPHRASLTQKERRKIALNLWAFFLGPFYFLAKGMPKRALSFVVVVLTIIAISEMLFQASSAKEVDTLSRVLVLLVYVVAAQQANRDYYRKVRMGETRWW
jgi:hypothetical protein